MTPLPEQTRQVICATAQITCFFKSLFPAAPYAWYNNGTGGGDADEYNDNL